MKGGRMLDSTPLRRLGVGQEKCHKIGERAVLSDIIFGFCWDEERLPLKNSLENF
jgi:hypothetical protein